MIVDSAAGLLAEQIRLETERWAKVIRDNNIRAD